MIGAFIGIVLTIVICGVLVLYICDSLRKRTAIGPGWDFDRDKQPVLFWVQLAVVAFFVIDQLWKLAHVLGLSVGRL